MNTVESLEKHQRRDYYYINYDPSLIVREYRPDKSLQGLNPILAVGDEYCIDSFLIIEQWI